MTTPGNGEGAAFNATVVTGHDDRTDDERAAEERRQAEATVSRLKTKRDKAAGHLADAEQALADAEAKLKGGQ